MINLLAVSGSLRAGSSNTLLLDAAAQLAPAGLHIERFSALADLPAFNPDREQEAIPAVSAWRAALDRADAVLFSTPEYAHGLPGALKNALDWVVGSGELYGKPAVLLNPSERGEHARASLREVLATMGAEVHGALERVVLLPAGARSIEEATADTRVVDAIRNLLDRLVAVLLAIKKDARDANGLSA